VTVYLVGAGPGDPGLITVRGLELLRGCDAVVYDVLVAPELLDEVPEGALAIPREGMGQDELNSLLVTLGRQGLETVRLKGGDPFIFGRGGEEAAALAAAGIPCEIVPGVTSALAAAAYSGIPLTHRLHSSSVVLLTGHEDPSKPDAAVHWEDYARLKATLCVYMGVKNLATIASRLEAGGLDASTPAAIIQSATTASQRRLLGTLGTIAELASREKVEAPAMLIIGEVAAFSEKLAWFESAAQLAVAR
jgi:uroporphyrinogen III methyltransferase/synthase